MKRRDFLKMTGIAAAGLAAEGMAREKSRPNILFIMTDQQFGDAMSCRIGDDHIKTPAMDSLTRDGHVFSRAYCANPLCVPSRASIFTGRYPHEAGVQTNSKPKLDTNEFTCMGRIFKRAGYDTGYFGKWHMPFKLNQKAAHGFEVTGNIRSNGADARTPQLASDFIRKNREKPFLLVASFNNPHNICEWARGQNLPDGAVGEPPSLNQCPPLKANHQPPENETDIIAHMRRAYQKHRLFPVGKFDDKKWREFIWAYYRMIEHVDRGIGVVLEALRESGREKDTLVVFTSDHGDCHGAHKWNQKTVFYDESTRVPFIISYRGVTRPGTSERLVQTGIDIIPTMCDFAGIRAPEKSRGLSLKAVASGNDAADPREYVVTSNKMVQCEPVDGVKLTPAGRMVRSKRYKYCIYSEGKRRESLVDMERDPGEMANLAGEPSHAEVLKQHRAYLAEHCRETSDGFQPVA